MPSRGQIRILIGSTSPLPTPSLAPSDRYLYSWDQLGRVPFYAFIYFSGLYSDYDDILGSPVFVQPKDILVLEDSGTQEGPVV